MRKRAMRRAQLAQVELSETVPLLRVVRITSKTDAITPIAIQKRRHTGVLSLAQIQSYQVQTARTLATLAIRQFVWRHHRLPNVVYLHHLRYALEVDNPIFWRVECDDLGLFSVEVRCAPGEVPLDWVRCIYEDVGGRLVLYLCV